MDLNLAVFDFGFQGLRQVLHGGSQLRERRRVGLFFSLFFTPAWPFHHGIAFSLFIHGAAQNFAHGRSDATLLEGVLDCFLDGLRLGLVGLGRGEHHHEEGE